MLTERENTTHRSLTKFEGRWIGLVEEVVGAHCQTNSIPNFTMLCPQESREVTSPGTTESAGVS